MSRTITGVSPTPQTPSRPKALTCTYALAPDQLDIRGRFLRHVPCGTAAHSLAPRTTHQDPDQVRTYPAWHSTFPLFIAGQERGQACTTSRPRTCWDHSATASPPGSSTKALPLRPPTPCGTSTRRQAEHQVPVPACDSVSRQVELRPVATQAAATALPPQRQNTNPADI